MSQVVQTIEHTDINLKQFLTELQKLNQQGFSGTVKIKVNKALKWLFLFRSGSLSWSANKNNAEEQLQRHLELFFPNLKETNAKSMVSESNLSKPCIPHSAEK